MRALLLKLPFLLLGSVAIVLAPLGHALCACAPDALGAVCAEEGSGGCGMACCAGQEASAATCCSSDAAPADAPAAGGCSNGGACHCMGSANLSEFALASVLNKHDAPVVLKAQQCAPLAGPMIIPSQAGFIEARLSSSPSSNLPIVLCRFRC